MSKKNSFKDRQTDFEKNLKAMVAKKTEQSVASILARQTYAEANSGKSETENQTPTVEVKNSEQPKKTEIVEDKLNTDTSSPSKKVERKQKNVPIKGQMGFHMTIALFPSDAKKLRSIMSDAFEAGFVLNKSQAMRLALRAATQNIVTAERIAEILSDDGRREV